MHKKKSTTFDADRWITVKPNGTTNKGQPALIGEGGEVKAGMGGKFNGKNIKDVGKKEQEAPHSAPQPAPKEKAVTAPTPTPQNQGASPSTTQKEKKITGLAANKAASLELSSAESGAFLNYSGAMFKDMNTRLRAGKGPSREDKKDLARMDEAFARASTKEPITVFRGVKTLPEGLVVGGTLTERGFFSTTTDTRPLPKTASPANASTIPSCVTGRR